MNKLGSFYYHSVKRDLFFGFETKRYGKNVIYEASLAKALFDYLYLRMTDLDSEKEIETYLNQDKFYNTYALGYDPLGHYSSTFAERIEGSYNNFLRGIPLEIMPDLITNANN